MGFIWNLSMPSFASTMAVIPFVTRLCKTWNWSSTVLWCLGSSRQMGGLTCRTNSVPQFSGLRNFFCNCFSSSFAIFRVEHRSVFPNTFSGFRALKSALSKCGMYPGFQMSLTWHWESYQDSGLLRSLTVYWETKLSLNSLQAELQPCLELSLDFEDSEPQVPLNVVSL